MVSRILAVGAALVAAIALSAGLAAAGQAPTCASSCITEYPVPIPVVYNGPFGLARGLADDIWFGDQDTISRIDRSGAITSYAVTPGAGVGWVTRGTDGAMWFTERFTSKIGRVDNIGRISEYPIPTPNSGPQGVVMDGNGIVWFTEQAGNKIGRLDSSTGTFTEYSVPTPASSAQGLALGPDDALWFTERNAAKIGRMTANGSFTEYPLTAGASPQRIVAAADGALWFTELGTNQVGRITTDGTLTEYPMPAGAGPVGIAVEPSDDAVWVVEFRGNKIARVALDGSVTDEFEIPSPNSAPLQITAGSDRTLWFSESFLSPTGNKIGKLDPYAR
jgi:virginiamycin B lyase